MYQTSPTSPARAIVVASRTVGATLPPAVIESYERAERITTASRGVTAHEGAMAAAVTDALDHGRDVTTDPAVVRTVVAAHLNVGDLAGTVAGFVGGQMRETFTKHSDQIVECWRGPFDTAANTLTAAHRALGDVSLDDGQAILRRGGDVAETWAGAITAVGVITTVESAWVMLTQITGGATVDRRYMVHRIADIDPGRYAELALPHGSLDPWQAVRLGLPLSLPTLPEYRARVANLNRVAEAEAAAEQANARAQLGASYKSR